MKRSERLQPVHELANETERGCALRVASVQKRLVDAQRRHMELERYLKEYPHGRFRPSAERVLARPAL